MKTLSTFLLSAFGLLLWSGCDTLDSTDAQQSEPVVEAYLVAGQPLPQIRLSRSTSVDEVYDFTALAIRGASVEVQLLDDQGQVEESYPYFEAPRRPGVYFPNDAAPATVLPLRTYALDVGLPDRADPLRARTVVPDTFSLVTTNLDTLVYQGDEQLELTVTRSFFPGRQNVFIFLTEALEPTFENLTPFIADVFEPDEEDLEDLASGASPLLNEGNYEVNPDDTITIKFPWLAVSFYGPNRLTASAVDDNVFDFVRSHTVQQGGSTLAPGEIPNVLDHVEGGTGVFGSYAQITYETFVKKPE